MRSARVCVFVAVAWLVSISAFAQATSSLRGKVIDAQGAAIPGVAVQLKNAQNGFARAVFSDETGAYSFLQVPPGAYDLSAELSGFATTLNKVTLQVNTPATLDLKMELAGLAETVQVQAEIKLINTVDATVGNAFSEVQV